MKKIKEWLKREANRKGGLGHDLGVVILVITMLIPICLSRLIKIDISIFIGVTIPSILIVHAVGSWFFKGTDNEELDDES